MRVLIDTNFLLAIASSRDPGHIAARQAMQQLKATRVIPAPVLPELFYLLHERIHYQAAMQTFHNIRTSGFQIEPLTDADMARMEAIMRQYADNQFDYVDTAIMALAERLDVRVIYTLDRRDFTVFRPSHCDYLELLP
jgi:uncharacterized protein